MCLLWLLFTIKLSSIFLFFSMVLRLHLFHLISWILQIRPCLKTGNLVSVSSKIFEKLVNMRIVGRLEFSFFLISNIILGLVMWLDLLALYLRFWFVEWYLCCNSYISEVLDRFESAFRLDKLKSFGNENVVLVYFFFEATSCKLSRPGNRFKKFWILVPWNLFWQL